MDFTITEFKGLLEPKGQRKKYTWEAFKDRMKQVVYTDETLEEYLAIPDDAKDEKGEKLKTKAKDVGGFVGGLCKNNYRSNNTVTSRCLLVIDADHAKATTVTNFLTLYDDVLFFAHTTHTSTEENPRLRWIFPLVRDVNANEYKKLTHIVEKWVGLDTIDDSSDQPARIMFWPSCSFDNTFHYWEGGNAALDPDELLDGYVEQEEGVDGRILGDDETVPEGSRNNAVFAFAAKLRQSGIGEELMRQMVDMFNDQCCNPPLLENEVSLICSSVSKYPKGEKIPLSLRTAEDDFGDLGDFEKAEDKSKKLESFNAVELNEAILPDIRYIVPGLIPSGLVIVASPPKYGKSWFCLDLVLSVATGTEILGMPTNKGEALYLALEDSKKRLQNRIRKVINGRPIPPEAHFVINAPMLEEGLLDSVDGFLKQYPKTSMIIIDTVQKIRGQQKKNEGVYGFDYREFGQLQKYAIDRNIAVVLVHHTNKNGDPDDFVNALNGSMGVAGAADETLVFERGKRRDQTTTLRMTGRDIIDKDFIVTFNQATTRWEMIGEAKDVQESEEEKEYRESQVTATILYMLDEASELSDSNIVEIDTTPKEILERMTQRYGEQSVTPVGVGKLIGKYADLLAKKNNVQVTTEKHREGTHYIFSRDNG